MYLLFSRSPADPLGEATIGGTCASVQTLSLIRVSLQAALSTHINSVMYSQDETIRLADSEKTELFWILLMKLGASPLLSKLG